MKIDKITDDLFSLIRRCYNQGTDTIRKRIIEECIGILVDSLNKQSDREALLNLFNNVERTS